MPDRELVLPDFAERLNLALDYAGMKPSEAHSKLKTLGIDTGVKYVYKLTSGQLTEPPRRIVAGLAAVLGTDARWFCEPDDDGALEAALAAARADRLKAGPEAH